MNSKKGALLWVIGVGMLFVIGMVIGSKGFEHWFNQLDAPTDGKDDPDTLRDRMSINQLRWSAPDATAHVVGRIELFNGNAFAVRNIHLTCMRSDEDDHSDTTEEMHAVIPGPIEGRTRRIFDAVDLGGPLKGAASVGCILTRAEKAAPAP